jgi:hypothetical protein
MEFKYYEEKRKEKMEKLFHSFFTFFNFFSPLKIKRQSHGNEIIKILSDFSFRTKIIDILICGSDVYISEIFLTLI